MCDIAEETPRELSVEQTSKLLQADVDLWRQGCWRQSPLRGGRQDRTGVSGCGKGSGYLSWQLAAQGHLQVQGLVALQVAQLWVVHLLRDSK